VLVGNLLYGQHLPAWARSGARRWEPAEGEECALWEELQARGLNPADFVSGWKADKLTKLLDREAVDSGAEGGAFWLNEEEVAQGERIAALLSPVKPRRAFGTVRIGEGDEDQEETEWGEQT
jgi:hypothetical protein